MFSFFQVMFKGIKFITMVECVRFYSKKKDRYRTKQIDYFYL